MDVALGNYGIVIFVKDPDGEEPGYSEEEIE
jgi:hypothetical protein